MPRIGGDLDVVQLSADPSTPVSGRAKLYFKSDGKLYRKTPDGVVTEVSGGSGGSTGSTTTTTFVDGGATPTETYDGIVISGPPNLHASTHGSGGTDPLSLAISQISNLSTELANRVTLDGNQVVTGVKTFPPNTLLMRSADGLETAEPYSDINAPESLERTILPSGPTPANNPAAGQSWEWTPDGKSLWMEAPDGTQTKIGPSTSGSTVYKKTANQSLTTTAVVSVTDLAFPIAANQMLEFEMMLAITSAALTTGWLFGFTGPAGITTFLATHEYQSSATAWATTTLQAIGNFPLVTAAYVITPSGIVVRIKGVVQNGTTAGTIQFVGGTEVASSAIVIRGGSTLKVA